MPELGHLAYYVRDLERSVAFYQKVVGLTVVARIFKGRAAVLTGGENHHDLLLIQITTGDGPPAGRRIGLYHAGWKLGNSIELLREALDRAQTYGTSVDGSADHGMMFSLYLKDPDGNEVELFVDNPEYDWSQDSSWMEAPVKPLDLSSVPQNPAQHPEPEHGAVARQDSAPIPEVSQNAPNKPQAKPATQQQQQEDSMAYSELQDLSLIQYWVQAAPNEPTGGLAQNDEDPQDPDGLQYWLRIAQEQQQQQQQPMAEAAFQGNQGDDDDDDPDSLAYWVRQAQQGPQDPAALPHGAQYQYPAQDPDSLEYWQQRASQEPPMQPRADTAIEGLDPDSLEYWAQLASSSAV